MPVPQAVGATAEEAPGEVYLPTCWLGERGCSERTIVGGKVANLSTLAEEFQVPPGFCLSAGPDDRPVDGQLPPALRAELDSAYRELGERLGTADPPVAVRSSGVDEDGELASFAGQHETFLNVMGAEAVATATLGCWTSAGTERVTEYRRAQGMPPPGESLPVLVQSLVVADVSAVVFSVNPVTGNRDEIVINASWGLGESIVGGTVTPDSFTVRREDLEVERRDLADKARMTVAVRGGTNEVDVPWALHRAPSITDDQASEMARLALALEDRFGWPTDIECCWSHDQLYLLQCRAVTAIPPTPERSAAWPSTSAR
jgi:phosphoenolpyruvate synthase/pyruvate phosphate dikinase